MSVKKGGEGKRAEKETEKWRRAGGEDERESETSERWGNADERRGSGRVLRRVVETGMGQREREMGQG